MAEADKETGKPIEKKVLVRLMPWALLLKGMSKPIKKKALLRLMPWALLLIAFACLTMVILTAPLPAPKTLHEVRSWPVPRLSTIDLLRTDWFKEAQNQRIESSLSAEQIGSALLGCWKYRNGRLGSFEGSFAIRSINPVTQTLSGFWNYDRGHALPLKGDYKIGERQQVLISLKNSVGAAYGRDLLLRKSHTTFCLCTAKSDPYAGVDFRALKTSAEMRPTVAAMAGILKPVTIRQLIGRWHLATAAINTAKNTAMNTAKTTALSVFEIDRVFDDGTFCIKGAPYDGGFIGDGNVVNIYIGDQAYNQLLLMQKGLEVTLNDADEMPVFAKGYVVTPGTGKEDSVLKGLYDLIQQNNEP